MYFNIVGIAIIFVLNHKRFNIVKVVLINLTLYAFIHEHIRLNKNCFTDLTILFMWFTFNNCMGFFFSGKENTFKIFIEKPFLFNKKICLLVYSIYKNFFL